MYKEHFKSITEAARTEVFWFLVDADHVRLAHPQWLVYCHGKLANTIKYRLLSFQTLQQMLTDIVLLQSNDCGCNHFWLLLLVM